MILLIAFVSVCTVTVANHELWRDEANAWLMGRESSSFRELLLNTQYTGHPRLWHALLMILAKLTSSPAAMQIFNLAIVVAAIWCFVRYSLFSTLHKTLFIFGFFPIYEYSVIARPYGLSLLLAFVFCLLFRRRNEMFLTVCTVVSLLANSSPVGFVVAAACGGLLLFDTVFSRGLRRPTIRQYAGFTLIALGGGRKLRVNATGHGQQFVCKNHRTLL